MSTFSRDSHTCHCLWPLLRICHPDKAQRRGISVFTITTKRFFAVLRMTKLSFVIGEFISGWSHAAWVKLMPCGPLKDERANDLANIEWQKRETRPQGVLSFFLCNEESLTLVWDLSWRRDDNVYTPHRCAELPYRGAIVCSYKVPFLSHYVTVPLRQGRSLGCAAWWVAVSDCCQCARFNL